MSDRPSSVLEGPSEEYLSTSLQPSYRTHQPTRKLLILDLNGTLLYRLPRPSRHRYKYQAYSDASPAPSRLTYPRPYLPSFRKYLFHPATREWLDVMVWSSAQPHSVRDMLKLGFPREEMQAVQQQTGSTQVNMPSFAAVDDRFFAVWARDTLGLSKADYSRKVQTIKDLEKVWTEAGFTSRSSKIPHPSAFDTIPESNDSPNNLLHSHSLLSTLLLDDSPLKARLQPWNHLCVREYDETSWKEDILTVKSWSQSRTFGRRVSVSASTNGNRVTDVTQFEQVSSQQLITEVSESKEPNLRKESTIESRIESSNEAHETHQIERFPNHSTVSHESHESSFSIVQQHDSTNLSAANTVLPASPEAITITPVAPISDDTSEFDLYSNTDTSQAVDETLLAIIGILEEIKYQSNVCGWFRSRHGLWIPNAEDPDTIIPSTQVGSATGDPGTASSAIPVTPENIPESSQSSSSLSYADVMSRSSEEIQNMPIPGLSSQNLNSASHPIHRMTRKRPPVEPLRGETKRYKSTHVPDSPPVTQPAHSPRTSFDHHPTELLTQAETGSSSSSPFTKLWFEDKNVFAYWVKEGKRALRELEIEELHGVEAI